MSNYEQHYNIAIIRKLLLEAFIPEELRRLCQYHPAFRPILDTFGPKYNLNDMVYEVIVYCQTRQLFDQLLAAIEDSNPRQYARFEKYLHTPDPNTYSDFVAEEMRRRMSPLGGFIQHVAQAITGDREAQRALRFRQHMLQLVRNTWIRDSLDQSLHGAAVIDLGMEERADAVEHPWDMAVQMPGQAKHQLPHSTRIMDVFDDMNESLLILGEPGSGKTTTLLELARDTINRAEGDLTQPIPVVFILSSWVVKKGPVAEWLVDELNSKYQIPEKIARPWVENDELLLLLDGLDEVNAGSRDDCVQALNAFCQEHLVPIAICSRSEEYEALTVSLKLHGAVLLQPLTPVQIDEYLEGAGTELLAVRRTLQHDVVLQEFARTPLMLSIMTLAYQGMSLEDLESLGSVDAHREHLFACYVQRMFERRAAERRFPPEQTVQWLVWLARRLSEQAQTIFLIEGLQPDWLEARRERRLYAVMTMLSVGLLMGLPGGLLLAVIGGSEGLLGTLWGLGGLLPGLLFGLLFDWGFELYSLYRLTVAGQRRRLHATGLYLGLIEPVEAVVWSWKRVGRALLLALVLGLCLGFLVGLLEETVTVTQGMLVGPLVSGLIGLPLALRYGLSTAELESKSLPNQGIRRSAGNAIVVGLLTWLVVGLGFASLLGLGIWSEDPSAESVVVAVAFGLAGGLQLAVLFGLLLGGRAAIRHAVLRFLLYRSGHMPRRLIDFLDYAAERILLRKVGGGYIFAHRLIQDYFASLETELTVRG